MANFISGFVNKASDGITDATSGAGSGVMDRLNSGVDAPSGDGGDSTPQDTSQGLHDMGAALKQANKARRANADEPASPGAKPDKKSNAKKVGKFLKSAFGFRSAAHKAGEAGEELTGQKLQMPFSNQN